MHRLIRINKLEALFELSAAGASWEAYVVGQIAQLKPAHLDMFYYRTQDGAEADVVLAEAGIPVSCIEIKLSNAPSLSKGFYHSIEDLGTRKNFVVIPDGESWRAAPGISVSGLRHFLGEQLRKLKR